MKREILIQEWSPRETRVAILEDDRLIELLVDRPELGRSVGNIYYGKVDAVLPGMQAAFIDIGLEKAGFLHASDLIEPDDAEFEDDDVDGSSKTPHKTPKIEELLSRGQNVLVQVTKEPISTKGARVTGQVSLPGRYLVYLPSASKIGVSRKIDSRDERRRLRKCLRNLLPAASGGIICRTASKDVPDELLGRELKSQLAMWSQIQKKMGQVQPPALVQEEASLTSSIIRDVFSDKIDNLRVDSQRVYQEIRQYLKEIDPDLLKRVQLHEKKEQSLFDEYGVEAEIEKLFNTRVNLPTGGYIIIEQTEALVSIDVNTGSYTGRRDPERTVLKTNMEAAREIGRQLRLRDVGGIIVIDFIDMEKESNKETLFHELKKYLVDDRARTRVYRVTELGLIQMTRQRVRPSLYQSMTGICPGCSGTGRVFKPEVVARHLDRSLRRISNDKQERQVLVRLHPEVALYLHEDEPDFMKQVRQRVSVEIELRDDPTIGIDEFRLVSQPAGRDVTEKYAAA